MKTGWLRSKIKMPWNPAVCRTSLLLCRQYSHWMWSENSANNFIKASRKFTHERIYLLHGRKVNIRSLRDGHRMSDGRNFWFILDTRHFWRIECLDENQTNQAWNVVYTIDWNSKIRNNFWYRNARTRISCAIASIVDSRARVPLVCSYSTALTVLSSEITLVTIIYPQDKGTDKNTRRKMKWQARQVRRIIRQHTRKGAERIKTPRDNDDTLVSTLYQ